MSKMINNDKFIIGFFDYNSNHWCYIRKGLRKPAFYNVKAVNPLLLTLENDGNSFIMKDDLGNGPTKQYNSIINPHYFWNITSQPDNFYLVNNKKEVVIEPKFKEFYSFVQDDMSNNKIIYTFIDFLTQRMSFGDYKTNGVYFFPENFNPIIDSFPNVRIVNPKDMIYFFNKQHFTPEKGNFLMGSVLLFLIILILGIVFIIFLFIILYSNSKS